MLGCILDAFRFESSAHRQFETEISTLLFRLFRRVRAGWYFWIAVANITRMDHKESYAHLRPLPLLIFSSRWLQLPLYLGLIVAQCVYVFLFLKELWHLVLHANEFGEQQIMLVVLGL
ncbi:MAG: YqhA family protein, partial [Alphaproteobacteria bacterium]